jgi:hypothetical protein
MINTETYNRKITNIDEFIGGYFLALDLTDRDY